MPLTAAAREELEKQDSPEKVPLVSLVAADARPWVAAVALRV
jgi:hypothetical protein